MLSSRDKPHVAGRDTVTYADFIVFEYLYTLLGMDHTILDGYPRLRDFVALVRARPRVAQYLASCSHLNSVADAT